MTPIISPWVFYLMPVCDGLKDMLFGTLLLIATAIIIMGLGFFITYDIDEDREKKLLRGIKKIIPFLVITMALYCFVPSEETITKMIVAQNVTFERLEKASNVVTSVYEDIMSLGDKNG